MFATSWWLFLHLVGTIAVNSEYVRKKQDLFSVDVEDADLLVPELIIKYGYKIEHHTVITEDGYVLKMFRILTKMFPIIKKKPVLFVHGLQASSANFVISGPSSIAYVLADNGYDVWLANLRGTRYSKEHTKLSVETKEYWNFSCHEIGYYDLPAMIDHVLNATNSEKLFYIGYSQGSTVYFIMTSTRPDYNEKIALMTGIAPTNVWKRIRNPLVKIGLPLLQTSTNTIKMILDELKIYEFLPYNKNVAQISRFLCRPDVNNNLCVQMHHLVFGPNREGTDPRSVLAYLGHFPQGASVKQALHFAQLLSNGGKFQQFDYGQEGNLEVYGSPEPPAYNLTASTAPVLTYYGLNDGTIHPRDIQEFNTMLPNVIATIPIAEFNHADFILARNARKILYEKILQEFEKFK